MVGFVMPLLHRRMSKNQWGTITAAPFPLGYQKMNSYEIQLVTERLHKNDKSKQCIPASPSGNNVHCGKLKREELKQLTQRLTKNSAAKAADQMRIPQGKLKELGIINSFAWKGWN